MPRLAVLVTTFVLLVGPTVLAFHAGGYFDGPRVVAAGVAWALVLLLALTGPLPWPTGRSGRLAVLGLAGLAAWTAISIAWTPLIGPAIDSVERALLYLGVLLAAVAVLRYRQAVRAVEPVLALGALVAIGYGLSGRLLPGVVDLLSERSYGAGGRLEQPITYWNAEGLLAGMGLLLCLRLAGDRTRPLWMRAAAAAACAPFGAAVYLTYSRGAVAVTVLGAVILLAAAPTWPQLRAAVTGLAAGALAAAGSAAFAGVASLSGSAGEQERDGAIVLAILLVLMAGAAAVTALLARREESRAVRLGSLAGARRLTAIAFVAVGLCVAGLVAGGLAEDSDLESAAPSATRFTSVSSVRYEYWRVALGAFWDDPLLGTGAGGFRVVWRMERTVPHAVTEVHSLPLGMLTELGIPGLAFLLAFLGGILAAGRRALRQGSPIAPGAIAVCVAWLLHATIDWDWQMPAVTLPALILAAGLLAAAEDRVPGAAPAEWTSKAEREPAPLTAAAG
jgi:hypothetical protein